MTVFVEGNLRFDFSNAIHSIKFDDQHTHGLSHCMKAVDFLVETLDVVLLIEVKDPDHPRAQAKQVAVFDQELKSGNLIAKVLVPKCRDTFIYQWCWVDRQIDLNKPWLYFVLIAKSTLQPAELMATNDQLRLCLPTTGPNGRHWRPFVQDCQVFNLGTWQKHLGQRFPVTRMVV